MKPKFTKTIDFGKAFSVVCKLTLIGYRVFIAYLLLGIFLMLKLALPAIYQVIEQLHYDLGGIH